MPNIPMTDELLQKCAKAEAYLQDTLFVEMFEVLEAQYIDMWKNAQTPEAREAAWYCVQALYDVNKGFRILAEKKQQWEEYEKRKAQANFKP